MAGRIKRWILGFAHNRCRVCGKIFFLERQSFNCCPHNGNKWGYGRHAKGSFECPVCGKIYTPKNDDIKAVRNAAYAAFACCPRPENENFRGLSESLRDAISRPKYNTLCGGVYSGSIGGATYIDSLNDKRGSPRGIIKSIVDNRNPTAGRPCPDCHATGKINGVMCDRCNGTGKTLV